MHSQFFHSKLRDLKIEADRLIIEGSGNAEISFVTLPSFAISRSSNLQIDYDRHKNKAYWILTEWDEQYDCKLLETLIAKAPVQFLEKAFDLKPTIKITKGEIAEKQYHQLINKIDKLQLKIRPAENMIGLDGVSYRLKIGHGVSKIEFHWWQILPDEWESLYPIIDEIHQLAGFSVTHKK